MDPTEIDMNWTKSSKSSSDAIVMHRIVVNVDTIALQALLGLLACWPVGLAVDIDTEN